MALKENYKDDILDVSVNTKRKYQMENNGDGTVSFTDVTEYTQQGDSFGSGDINATNVKVNTIDSAVATLDANLDGFKFYPTGTGIVGLISDDSAYTDEDGNYVLWGTATANQLVADNPNTYKSVPSTEDTRGKEGEDTAKSFGGVGVKRTIINKTISVGRTAKYSVTIDIRNDYPDYANIDISNIFVVFDELTVYSNTPDSSWYDKSSLSYTYSNGIITITSNVSSLPFTYVGNSTLAVRVVIC